MTRRRYLAVTALAAIGIAAANTVEAPTKLIWNATASAPVGFYTVEPADALDVPELVAVQPPEPLAAFMVGRGYVGRGVPLLKRVLGLPGQRVCRLRSTITVDGIEMGDALDRDRIGRELPIWQGCRIIGDDEIFLMNWEVRDSLDGRYFGPIPADSVIGRAVPLWTDEEGVGRFEWRAPTTDFPTRRRLTMPANIFEPTANGYAGRVRLLGIDEAIVLVAIEPGDGENTPAYRIQLDDENGPEIGGAWKRVGERAGDYIALEIDSPLFPALFRPALFQADEEGRTFRLAWKRPRAREDRG